MIRFVVDSASDNLCRELVQRDKEVYSEFDIRVVPLVISTDNNDYWDDEKLDVMEMISVMEKYNGKSQTACPSVDSWLKAFRGAKEICVVTITSGLSGSYNSAVAAKEVYLQECPDAKVEIIDSLSTGPGMRMPLELMMENCRKGLPIEEVAAKAREYIKSTHTYFALQSIHNLAQNGRVSKLIEKAVGILGIRLVGIASEIGTIEVISKARGDKKTFQDLMTHMEKNGYRGGKIRICYVDSSDMADRIAAALKEKYGEIDVLAYPAGGLCSFYAERNGIILCCES